MSLRFVITGRGRPGDDPTLTLQLKLKPGETLETGAGRKIVVGSERIDLGPEELGGWVRHHGWTLRVDPATRLVWPVYPFNPYANGPEKDIEQAVGALHTPLKLKPEAGRYIRAREQEITFVLEAD
jgi:hypothetical protein